MSTDRGRYARLGLRRADLRARGGETGLRGCRKETLSERRRREDEIQRLIGALPHLAALREAESAVFNCSKGLPAPPDGWRDEVTKLQAEAIKLAAQREGAESAVKALQDELERIGGDAAALKVAAHVDAWRELRSRYDSAADIPVRQGELAAKRDAVQDILRRLGREGEAEPQELLAFGRDRPGALEDLIARRSGVLSRLRAARDRAAAALEEARGRAGPGGFEELRRSTPMIKRARRSRW